MIPVQLTLSGFLSYCDPVEIDFTTFDLACISGPNGSGKSSLLDAITWSLFGQARTRDDSLINSRSDTAEVVLDFIYEDNLYRVQRVKPRDKTTLLEFHICQDATANGSLGDSDSLNWKPLTERTMRETQTRIQDTLRLDYETFVNAAFFLQGKADQFTQQRPSDRKRILGSILGLEVWEQYRGRAGERRREIQGEVDNLDGRLQEIDKELNEEAERRARLEQLEGDLSRLVKTREAAETAVEGARQVRATLEEQRRLVETLGRQADAARRALEDLERRHQARGEEREAQAEILSRAEEIEAAHQAWQGAREELGRWEEVAARFREHEGRRAQPLTEVETARARLEAEQGGLQQQEAALVLAIQGEAGLREQLKAAEGKLQTAQVELSRRETLEAQLREAREEKAHAAAENPRLKAAMEDLRERIDQLSETEGALCPLCGQPLSPEDRERLMAELTAEGKDMGDQYRANKVLLEESQDRVRSLEEQIGALAGFETEARELTRETDQFSSQLEAIQAQKKAWDEGGGARLAEIEADLKEERYAAEARAQLAVVDAELKEIGYDAAAHDRVRAAEREGRTAEEDHRALERARAALAPLEREIGELEAQISQQREQSSALQAEHDEASVNLASAEAEAPDLHEIERELYNLQEEENRLRMQVGAARQKVLVLDDLKTRKAALLEEKEALIRDIGLYKQLERAFGKDGVPALLIEQALPQIETKANEVLERLSGGTMSVRFITQAAYKDKSRDDLRETLDIQISDSAGARDYEMYSGGEAFRVNFAVRLALAEVLAQRAGARLQTLVIDEGFGSQDTAGRQRLLEAINLVRGDFAKILVITHIDELKEAFPNRLEVEKTERGSVVQLV